MTGVAERVRNSWSGPRVAGYRPGLLLERVRHDLGQLDFQAEGVSAARFRDPRRDIEFEVRERVEAHFLMHVVTSEFLYRVPDSAPGSDHIELRHRGRWKREGIAAIPTERHFPVHDDLERAVLPLDFTRFDLTQDEHGWHCRISHYGASEVVFRVPPLRRYVRLAGGQVAALLDTFAALRRLPGHATQWTDPANA